MDRQGQTEIDMLREKAALGILSAHLGRDYRHAESVYAKADGVLYGGIWTFVEHKSRVTSYGNEWWMPVRKVRNLMELCVEHEALPLVSVWYLDKPGLGEFYYRFLQHDDIQVYGTGRMKPHIKPREGISEDHSEELACVFPLSKAFKRVF